MASKTSGPQWAFMPAEPAHRLADNARWVWRLQGLLISLAALVAAAAAPNNLGGASAGWWPLLALPAVCVLVGAIPELRWRRWRYEVRDEEIDIQHGTVRITRTLVPMLRVQHVDTVRGALEQALDLSTVVVHTAAGRTTIPLLHRADAAALRDRIAVLARRPDDL
jgi:uncharacterized protein